MAQNAFRPYTGKWLMKEFVLKATAGVVEKGDLVEFASRGTVALATNDAISIIGIAAADYATSTAVQTIKIFVPAEPKAEMIGRVTDGAIALGVTDSGATCDVEDHEGADTDTDTHHHLYIVKGTVASADGSTATGEAIFRIAQTPEFTGGW